MTLQIEEDSNPMTNFVYALRAPETKRQYPRRLAMFFDFLKLEGSLEMQGVEFLRKARTNRQWAQDALIRFVINQKERVQRGGISESTVSNYYKATKLFCEMNDLVLSWKRISKGLPRVRKAANDRASTVEEIQTIVEYPDRRIKPIVYVMASSGIRIGAWDHLKWKHVTPINDENDRVVAAKVVVYAGDAEEYYTFTSFRLDFIFSFGFVS
jgi:hypothetical protein